MEEEKKEERRRRRRSKRHMTSWVSNRTGRGTREEGDGRRRRSRKTDEVARKRLS